MRDCNVARFGWVGGWKHDANLLRPAIAIHPFLAIWSALGCSRFYYTHHTHHTHIGGFVLMKTTFGHWWCGPIARRSRCLSVSGVAMGVALHGKVAMPRLLGYWVIRPIVPESACVSVRGCNGVFDIQALVPSRARSCSLLQFGNRLHDAYKIPVVASLQWRDFYYAKSRSGNIKTLRFVW